jgi:HSP20 family protein
MGDPMREFHRLQDEINQLFNTDRPQEQVGLFDRRVSPAVDIVEQSDQFVVMLDLPGVKKEDLDITIAEGALTVKGEKRVDDVPEDTGSVYRVECWKGTFQRTIGLPRTVDPEKIDAELTNGVLTVSMAKREEVKPRQVSINVQ